MRRLSLVLASLILVSAPSCTTVFARRCDPCGGTGRVDCLECTEGKKDCPKCNTIFGCSNCRLSTKVDCFACNGRGSFPCKPCSGTGRKQPKD